MNFKRFHESKNLAPEIRPANGWVIGYRQSSNGSYVATNNNGEWLSPKIPVSVLAENKINISAMQITNPSMSVYFWNGDTYLLYKGGSDYSGTSFTIPENATHIDFALRAGADKKTEDAIISSGFWVMLNLGSTALPYEPNSSEVWHDTPHYIMGTSTDTLTTLPAVLYPNDTTATVGLQGNMSQTGTPTSDSPVMPQGTGERTGNLLNPSSTATNTQGVERYGDVFRAGTYCIINNSAYDLFCRDGVSSTSGRTISANASAIITTSNELVVWHTNYSTDIMVAETDVIIPFEPYGYKIPISSVSITTPVYLGEVDSTRRIKKLVLTGNETGWNIAAGVFYNEALSQDYLRAQGEVTILCSHYSAYRQVSGAGSVPSGSCSFYYKTDYQRLYINDSNYSTVADFKSYLAQQYANGTPVCVWYVLATPTTGIVNEPLMKIGGYADEVSNVSIPVTAGGDTLSIGTTLQPSEVTVNYKGWHPVADVHERDNGAWT